MVYSDGKSYNIIMKKPSETIIFYLKERRRFDFSPKFNSNLVVFDENGADGIKAFEKYDNEGKIVPTKHKRIFNCLLRVKGGVNWQIKQWAEGISMGVTLPIEIKELLEELHAPEWVFKAVQRQKWHYYSEEAERRTAEVFRTYLKSDMYLLPLLDKLLRHICLYIVTSHYCDSNLSASYLKLVDAVAIAV